MTPDLISIAQVKRAYASKLFGSKNVVACGIGFKETGGKLTDELCMVVSVSKKLPKTQLTAQDFIPRTLDSVKTDVQEVGIFRALQTGTRDKHRPAMPGISCGHVDVSAGTFGCLVRRGDDLLILSNNHVLANSNKASKGDIIIQPGQYDGGTSSDQIATLEDWVPLNMGAQESTCPWAKAIVELLNVLAKTLGSSSRIAALQEKPAENVVDCAIARPLSPDLVTPAILQIGVPNGVAVGALGMQVQKTGRTTGYTTGKITQVDVTVQVDYDGQMVQFVDQFMATGMSAGGDSGSAMLDMAGNVIGLLFAGSELATLFNPIQAVLDALSVDLVT
ncbi:MAG: hypothetical protein JXA89_07720 [Anaerolineae bacterium]|nr:hypothetical protein [Anaerolineae bacterium]